VEVAAVVHAGHHAAPAGPATDAAEYPWPEMATEITVAAGPAPPAEPLDGLSAAAAPQAGRGALPDAAPRRVPVKGPDIFPNYRVSVAEKHLCAFRQIVWFIPEKI
jgi:hypothetical protein